MSRNPPIDALIIGKRGILETDAIGAQPLNGGVDVVGRQTDMLNAFAIIVADEFLDLALVILALVQRNAERTIGRDHRLADKTRRLPLDFDIFLFDEAEEAAVTLRWEEGTLGTNGLSTF